MLPVLFGVGLIIRIPVFFWEMKVKVDSLEFSGVGNVFLQQKSPSKVLSKKLVGWLALMFVVWIHFYESVGCLILIG